MSVQYIGQVTNIHRVNIPLKQPISNVFHRRVTAVIAFS